MIGIAGPHFRRNNVELLEETFLGFLGIIDWVIVFQVSWIAMFPRLWFLNCKLWGLRLGCVGLTGILMRSHEVPPLAARSGEGLKPVKITEVDCRNLG